MKAVSVREARARFRALLNMVAAGEEIAILRRGKQTARLVPPARTSHRLPDLTAFRRTIRLKGTPMSSAVIEGRRETRY